MVLNALPISGPHFPCLSNGIIVSVLPTSQGYFRDQKQAQQKKTAGQWSWTWVPTGSDSHLASGRPQTLCGSFSLLSSSPSPGTCGCQEGQVKSWIAEAYCLNQQVSSPVGVSCLIERKAGKQSRPGAEEAGVNNSRLRKRQLLQQKRAGNSGC